MSALTELQAEAARLRAARDGARAALLAAKAALDRTRGSREEAMAQRAFAAARERFAGESAALAGALGQEAFADPRKLVEGLADSHPILLFPLRLETKFGTEAGRPVLRVRIFPDAASVTAHDAALSEGEIAAGRAFWVERAIAAGIADPVARAAAVEGAWTALVASTGETRALFLLARLRPANWPDLAAPPPDPLEFPADAVAQTSGATPGAAPRARLLPERIVVSAYRAGAGAPAVSRLGAPIPDDLLLGPDPRAVEATLTRDALERLAPDPAIAWMFDYEAAVEAGLAVTLPLEPAWLRGGFSTITALGVKLSMDPDAGGKALAGLIDAHRFTGGFDLIANGTPTNNTERAPSGFSSDPQPSVSLFRRAVLGEVAEESDDPLARSDAEHLARALGVPFAAVRALQGATRTDITEQVAMTRALWPATLGAFLHEMARPALSAAERDQARDFATRFVSARGPLPPVRIGHQPYGLLPASSFSRWAFAAEDRAEIGFLEQLRGLLARLLEIWRRAAASVPRVSLDDADHAAFLLTVGQQASAAQFLSRKGVSDRFAWNWLNYPFPRNIGEEAWGALNAARAAALGRLGFDVANPDLKLNSLLWRAGAAPLDGPVVDGEPALPLSEAARITAFDGARNYIHFLATATRADIEAERLARTDGTFAPAPRALLYKYLRQAVLAETDRVTLGFLADSAFPFLQQVEIAPDMANIGAEQHLTVRDLGEVNARTLGLSAIDQPVGAFALDRARTAAVAPALALPLLRPFARQVAAMQLLAELPTARLERLFAEHVDLVSCRLDAWIGGLYARRLAQMRAAKGAESGILVGAYGYVENLRPKSAQPEKVAPADLPEELREAGIDVFRRADNGGFVHAPSLTHAVSAAVLRDAYLSTADVDVPRAMAIDLSSARVRAATALLDGLRNGQELAALIGYLLERTLDDHPLRLTLQEAKYRLRERFPFVSNKLTPLPDDTAVEAAEARNVVNGVDLLRQVAGRAYPYDISGLPADPARAAAVTAAVDAANNAFDALGDLLNAEAVHQVVQSNMERARGVVQATGEAELAPMPDVVATPRSGTSLVQRVAVFLPEGPGWHGAPGATPRAKAAPRLDHWLAGLLPAPGEIEMRFSRPGAADAVVGLDASGLEAIDVVLMGAETLGDGSSILERHLVARFRAAENLDDDAPLLFDPAGATPGRFSLKDVWPLLSRLRQLVLAARTGDASDFRPASAQPEERANPRGFDAPAGPLHDQAEYAGRVADTLAGLDAAIGAVEQILAAPATAARIAALAADPASFVPADWAGDLAALRAALGALVPFGLPEALPASITAVTAPAADALARQAASVVRVARKRHAEATALAAPPPAAPLPADPDAAADARAAAIAQRVDTLGAALSAAFGGSVVPTAPFAFAATEGAAVGSALANPIAGGAAVDAALEGLARVRPKIDGLCWIATFQDFIGRAPPSMLPVQTPAQPGAPWIGGPTGAAALPEGITSVTLAGPPPDASGLNAMLVVDEWTEILPTAKETTGIAFHFDRPNACAPQALLLAVPPRRTGAWSWDDLAQTVLETMEAARLRAVETEALMATDLFHALPATAVEFATFAAARPTILATNAVKITTSVASFVQGATP